MARLLRVKTEDIKTAIQLEGRPWANTARSENTDGNQLEWNEDNKEWRLGTKSTFGAGGITIAPGRAIFVEAIILSSDQPGFIEGFFRYNEGADWVGSEDANVGGATDGTLRVATNGSPVTIPVNRIYSEFFNVTITRFVPTKFRPNIVDDGNTYYPRQTPVQPNLAVTVIGTEITNDLNFGASKILGFAGDSLSWSLIGDYRNQDIGYNLTGANDNFPPNFGEGLAAMRLVNALRKENDEDIRLVNKGFGGSKLAKEQWFMLKSGAYTFPWNIFVLQAGANDAGDVQSPLVQLTFKSRMRDFCSRRLQDGHTYRDSGIDKPYPIVFCTAPSLDDKSGGLNSRNNLDVRPPLTGENYDDVFTASLSGEVAIDLDGGTWLKVEGSNSSSFPLYLQNGTAGSVYRIDFTTQVFLSIAGASKPLLRVLESLEGYDGATNTITVKKNTVMYFKCVTADEEYHEVDRVNLVGVEINGPTLHGGSPNSDDRISHFIMNPSTRIRIEEPVLSEITQVAEIRDAAPSDGVSIPHGQSYLALRTGLTTEGLPASSSIATNDVWVRISGMSGSSWSNSNGFYKVMKYSVSGNSITAIWINLDSRTALNRSFSTYNQDSGDIELIKCRDYIVELEGTESKSSGNCAYIQNGYSVTDMSGNYTIKWELKSGATFDLIAGKGIALGCYQQGKTIFMREIVSGDIVNTGSVKGAATEAAFYGTDNEKGKTRMGIVNNNITAVVNEYSADDNVYLVDLNNYQDLKDVSETTGKRLRYGTTDEVSGSSYTWKVGDLIEDRVFKRVGDTGINECVVGSRVHRSPYGHELMYNRLWATIKDIKIPS